MQLFKAHNQWKNRPADERFKNLTEMNLACSTYRDQAVEADVPCDSLRVEVIDNDLKLVGKTGVPAVLSHWSMGQLSSKASAPPSYLRTLPATLAAQNLNHGLKNYGSHRPKLTEKLLFHENGSLVLRSSNTEKYTRIWNADITSRLLDLQAQNPNWVNPMAYEIKAPAKEGGWPTLTGKMVPSGLYASDHDMFSFLIDESKKIDGSPAGLNRGFFTWNSEVGEKSFGIMTFLYDQVCGNNIVWGASNVTEFRLRHVGNADERAFGQIKGELKRYIDSSGSEAEAMIKKARTFELGNNKDEILDSIMKMVNKIRIPDLPKTRVLQAVELAEQRTDRYGNPNTMWAVVGGLTEASQWSQHADERVKVDRAAGRLLKTISF